MQLNEKEIALFYLFAIPTSHFSGFSKIKVYPEENVQLTHGKRFHIVINQLTASG